MDQFFLRSFAAHLENFRAHRLRTTGLALKLLLMIISSRSVNEQTVDVKMSEC